MPTPLTDTDKKQQMRSTRKSNIAVRVSLYVHQIEMNLVYEKSNGLAPTLCFKIFP
jgi:hypothetical protein